MRLPPVSSGASALTTEPLQLALLVPSLALAWIITFNLMFMIGAVAFFVTKTMALMNLYFALFSLLSAPFYRLLGARGRGQQPAGRRDEDDEAIETGGGDGGD